MVTLPRLCLLGLLTLASAFAAAPVLQRQDSIGLVLGDPLEYHVVAAGAGLAFSAQGLPPGVTIDGSTGVLRGKPTQLGAYPVRVTVTNADGSATETVHIAVVAPDAAPLIYAPLIFDAFLQPGPGGDTFSCTLKATGSPTAYQLTGGLPANWSFSDGTLVGRATQPGIFPVDVAALNGNGVGSATINVRVHPACSTFQQTTGELRAGDGLTVTLQFSRPVTFAGEAPYLEFHTYPNGETRRIAYVSGNGTSSFVFRYTIAANDAPGDILLYKAIQPAANGAVVGLEDGDGLTLGSSLPIDGPYTPVAKIVGAATPAPAATPATGSNTADGGSTTGGTSGTSTPAPVATNPPTPTGTGSSTTTPGTVAPPPTGTATETPPPVSTPATSGVASGRLVNLSARGSVADGDSSRSFIAGFVVGGSGAKRMLVRAIGPSLSSYGVQNALANPRLRVFDSAGKAIAESDDWSGTETSSTSSAVGAFALSAGSRDAALTLTLEPGSYSMQILPNGGSGVALAEVYDADAGGGSALLNLSMRGQVGTGENVLTAGFVVTGSTPKRVLVRGVGPALAAFGVAGAISNPTVTVYRGNTPVVQNDDWGAQSSGAATDVSDVARDTGAFALPAGGRDAALVVTLEPGTYTAVVSPAAGTSPGAGLVEVYEVK